MRSISVVETKVQLVEEVVGIQRECAIVKNEEIKKPLKPVSSMEKFRASFPRIDISSAEVLRQLRDEGY